MPSDSTQPKHRSKISKLDALKKSGDQLQPPYPRTIDFAKAREERDNPSNSKASPYSHTSSTRSSSFGGPAGKQTDYMAVGRHWGYGFPESSGSSVASDSPMSRWQYASANSEPWNAIGRMAIDANAGQRPVECPSSKDHRLKKNSERATKGSSGGVHRGAWIVLCHVVLTMKPPRYVELKNKMSVYTGLNFSLLSCSWPLLITWSFS